MALGVSSVPIPAACPHCGRHAAVFVEGLEAFCQCSTCGARGPRVTLAGYGDLPGLSVAIEAYNRRVVISLPFGGNEDGTG